MTALQRRGALLLLLLFSRQGSLDSAFSFNVQSASDGRTRLQSAQVVHFRRRNFIRDWFWGTAAVVSSLATNGPNNNPTVAAKQPQYETAADIPDDVINSHQTLYGYVERVIDGDTIRIRHIPEYMIWQGNDIDLSSIVNSKGPIGNTTIVVRMYGIDAPETAKKKSETSQPFGEEAKQFTKDMVFHKVITVKLLKKDKYQRILGEVETFASTASLGIFSPPKDLSVELVSRGLATLYSGGGAEYDGKRDLLKQRLEAAQRAKLGIWSLGDDLVTPAEYKRAKKAEAQL